jgi:hypothetical protein
MTDTLVKRREKVLRTWLTAVNPVVDFALSDAGELSFVNAASRAGVTSPAQDYTVEWFKFDNATATATKAGDASLITATTAAAPAALIAGARAGDFVQMTIAARHAEYPSWATPVTVHFRRASNGWELVGVRRLPD